MDGLRGMALWYSVSEGICLFDLLTRLLIALGDEDDTASQGFSIKKDAPLSLL